jgi:hypothetical protein
MKLMNRTGVFGDFHWVEIDPDDVDVPAVMRLLAAEAVGLTAVNVSWDSGHMVPTPEQQRTGWRTVGEFAVSPVIDEALLSNWPASTCQSGRFDEWYFFREIDVPLSLQPFCNWLGLSLENAVDLAFSGGFDLQAQLNRYRPELVVGDGEAVFVISPRLTIVELLRTRRET